jgi:C_GCAxxG_C_C family probable redox protein
MKFKIEKSLVLFRSGLNCSQTVLTAYTEDLHFDNNLALNISSGFGAGMGRLQETCGAVTGAYMVLGIFNGNKYDDNKLKKEETYILIQDFSEKFKQIHGTTDCKSLLNCDISSETGMQYAIENNLFGTICEKCIIDSISIIEEIINK